jgi:hypothetical protein
MESWKQLKRLSLETDLTLQDLAIDGYNRILMERGMPQIDEAAQPLPEPEPIPPTKKRPPKR